jgi:hypothetical protein
LKVDQLRNIDHLKSKSKLGIDQLKASLDSQLSELRDAHQTKVMHLEEEISYLRELSTSQRLMLDAKIDYIKNLEDRLGASSLPPSI